jgi:two-component system, OmpR family, sensor histidine kinase BaeS
MKHYFRNPRPRPSWWPENEPWPPPAGYLRHRNKRNPLLIRFGCLIPLFFLSTGALCTMVGATIGIGLRKPPDMLPPWAWIAIPLGVVFAIWCLVAIILRRLVSPMGAVMDASDRLAAGDYTTRIAEHGLHDFGRLAHSFNSLSSRLQTYDQQRKRLLADISHELRTPLTVLQGNLEAMLDNVYPRDDDHLRSVLEETHILARLIEDLRTISLAETGRLPLQKAVEDPQRLIEEVVAAMQNQASTHAIHLVAQPALRDLPVIDLDAARIRQVLENLISNSLRHTPADGSVFVSCEIAAGPPNGIAFTVTDNGRGIAPADINNIFNRYYKTVDSGGTGLGLAIAKQLVEAHGGSIQAESTLGQGTKMRFQLPLS